MDKKIAAAIAALWFYVRGLFNRVKKFSKFHVDTNAGSTKRPVMG